MPLLLTTPAPTSAVPTHPSPTHPSLTHPSPTHPDPTHPDPTHPDPTHPYPTHPISEQVQRSCRERTQTQHFPAGASNAKQDRKEQEETAKKDNAEVDPFSAQDELAVEAAIREDPSTAQQARCNRLPANRPPRMHGAPYTRDGRPLPASLHCKGVPAWVQHNGVQPGCCTSA